MSSQFPGSQFPDRLPRVGFLPPFLPPFLPLLGFAFRDCATGGGLSEFPGDSSEVPVIEHRSCVLRLVTCDSTTLG